MSVAAAAKAALVGEANVLAALLPKVKIAYSQPTKDIGRELVYGGTVLGAVELAAMAGGGRVKRSENLTLQLHIRVWKPNAPAEDTAARAVEIATVIGNYIAANWTLGGLPSLIKATVDGIEMDSWTDDDGSGTTLTMAVGLTSYLT